jgi:hypothetical protein
MIIEDSRGDRCFTLIPTSVVKLETVDYFSADDFILRFLLQRL